jgi:hypothetical protein
VANQVFSLSISANNLLNRLNEEVKKSLLSRTDEVGLAYQRVINKFNQDAKAEQQK